MNEYLLHDPSWNGPLIVAVQRAIAETYSKSDWNEVGHLTGQHAYSPMRPKHYSICLP